MFALLVTREIATVDIDIKILGVPPPGASHAFLRQQHMRRGGGVFLPGFSSLYDAIHGCMTGRMDGRVT